jgi:hypothetical protein
MTETNSETTSKPTSTTGGKQPKRRGLPGLQIELDSEKLLDLLATGGPQIEEQLRLELVALATSLLAAAQELNERVMATGSYAIEDLDEEEQQKAPALP